MQALAQNIGVFIGFDFTLDVPFAEFWKSRKKLGLTIVPGLIKLIRCGAIIE